MFYLLSFFFILMISIFFFILMLYFFLMDLIYFFEWEIISVFSCSISMILLFDWMSLLFMSFVLFISSMVIYYSSEYMMNNYRFILLILLFVISMMMMIISPNLVSILLGWDGLGLVSYCLIIFFQNIKSFNSGMLTALSNRIGDVMLLIAISWMLNFGSWTFYFYLDFMKNDFEMKIISMFVVIAAMTKSAQIPFSSWLPAAMAAPTPVSALVHSSTLVTAGVYLLIRFNLLINNYICSKFLLILASMTMFMSSLSANFEIDLKKIIALSTLSQLSFMMMILSLKFYKLAFFHLLTHALFKALLFLCAGGFIHNLLNFQDIRLSGNYFNQMPLTSTYFNISKLALCGMPFLAGFYSKDLILEMICMMNLNFLMFFIFFISSMLTVVYSFRMIFFISIMSMNNFSILSLLDENWLMLKAMTCLNFLVVVGGSMLSWIIFPFFSLIMLPFFLKFLILLICVMGGLIGYFLFKKNFFNLKITIVYLKFFFSLMWFIPMLSTEPLNIFFLKNSKYYFKNFEYGFSEMLGNNLLFNYFKIIIKYFEILSYNQFKNIFFSYSIFMMILFLIF